MSTQAKTKTSEQRIADLEKVVYHLIDIVHDMTLMDEDKEWYENTEETRIDLLKLQTKWEDYGHVKL